MSSIFEKSFRKIGVSYFLNVWWNSPGKPSDPQLFFIGKWSV
jgi:hypothetical protein